MQISDRIKSIKPSLTLAMNAKALELKEQGVMVTSLAVGEPDFPRRSISVKRPKRP